MPAHQHCDLFYPLGWGSAWVCHKLGNVPVLWSGTGSWVLVTNRMLVIRLVQLSGWVFENKERKRERFGNWALPRESLDLNAVV